MTEPNEPTKDLPPDLTETPEYLAPSPETVGQETFERAGPTAPIGGSSARDMRAHKSIDRYQLLKKLGEGGMGQVWLAEQTTPVRRQVALKLIKIGLYDDAVLQRFQAERQSLAIMNHPSIAKVFDAGTTPDGQPYFVMEYVPGSPISDYCDQKKLPIRERLQLFIKVCEAVQHAHQKAIIHRDLKPANILVAEIDGKPTPRIIDFGLAKAVTAQFSGDSNFTQAGAWVGTPGYISPEQTEPGAEDIDTRTDLYSLGVILYFLLTGFLPFDPKQWHKQLLNDVLRQWRETDPPTPSARLDAHREASSATAAVRGSKPKELARMLQGDLDWITMKALERDRNRRYGSPSELAADIERYLDNRPVSARPASATYRLQKYARRHRAAVAIAAGLVLLLAGFVTLQAVQLRRTTRERDRANRITDFMTDMFKVLDPSQARGNSITVREILDKASRDINSGLTQDPQLQAHLMYTMAIVYGNLGLSPRAQSLFEQAIEIQRRVLGPQHPDTLKSTTSLAWTLSQQGRYAEAEKLTRQSLAVDYRVLKSEHPDTLSSMSNLGWILYQQGHYAEAEKLQRKVLDMQRRVLGPDDSHSISSISNLASTLSAEGRYTDAEALEQDALTIENRVLGAEHPDTLVTKANLAAILREQGRHAEAEKLQREMLEIQRRVLGPDHPYTLRTVNNLSSTLSSEHQYAQAETFGREALNIGQRVLGPDTPEALTILENLAIILSYEQRYVDAQQLFREAIQRAKKSPETSSLSDAWYAFACGAAITGHPDEAFQYLHQAIDHGYSDADGMAADEDLKSLRGDPRFAAFSTELRERSAAAQKPK